MDWGNQAGCSSRVVLTVNLIGIVLPLVGGELLLAVVGLAAMGH